MIRPRRIGERGRRFTLEVPIETPDGFGGVLRSYQAGPRLWGAMELVSAAERVRGGRPDEVVTHRVTLPFRPDVDERSRLTLGLRRFRVRSAADPDGRRREIVCLVEELRP